MPVKPGTDTKGSFFRWGKSGKKYYYTKGNKASIARARAKAAKQGQAAYAAGYKGNDMLQRIKANFTGGVRKDEMMGRPYLVAPMVMMVEGVHDGSNGPLLYPADELAKIPQIWNHKPVVVYHPAENGESISACDPFVLSKRQVGVIMNTKFEDGKLKAEAWLEEGRMDKVDERIAEAVEKNTMMELSTGLFTNNESAEENAEWNGEKYDAIARDYRPDHLALLPDLKGACSIEDGAGFLRLNANPDKMTINANTLSHGNIRSMLNSWAHSRSSDMWVETVYDKSFIYEDESNGKFYQREYDVKDNVVMVNNMTAVEVVRVTEWRTKDGNKFVGNKKDKESVSNKNKNESDSKVKENIMDKGKIVDALIECNTNSWGKDDKKALMEMDEKVLEKMQESDKAAKTAVENAAKKGAEEATEKMTINQQEEKKKEDDKASAGNEGNKATDKTNDEKATENKKPKTTEEYIADAPTDELRGALNSMLTTHKNIKAKIIKKITDNEKNQFTEDELNVKDLTELKKLVAILPGIEKVEGSNLEVNDFSGLEDVEDITENTEEPMMMPAVVGEEVK